MTYPKDATIAYFGFGTNKDLEMMQHMVGRKDIEGVSGRLIGYDVCVQRAEQFRTTIPPNSIAPISPHDLIIRSWSKDFLMYVSRPNPTGIAHGVIWYLTPLELELVRYWEIVDFGAQDDAYGWALTDDGELVKCITQSFVRNEPIDIDHVEEGPDYEPYIWDKQAMLDKADELRAEYLGKFKK